MPSDRFARAAVVTAALLAVVVASIAGCAQLTGRQAQAPRGTDTSQGQMQVAPKEAAPPGTSEESARSSGAGAGSTAQQQMVIRNKTLQMRVDSVRTAVDKIDRLAKRNRGYITDSSISSQPGVTPQPVPDGGPQTTTPSDDSGPLFGSITVKVPVASFDEFVRQVRKLGTVRGESESSENVTQQHIDLVARVRNLQAEEKRLIEFLHAAKNVREMLLVENELSRVRGEIESLQGQIDYLEKQAAMGTLTVQLSEPGAVVSPGGQDWGVVSAITDAIRYFVGVINFLIRMFGALLPLVLALLIAFWIVRWMLRRFVFRKTQ